MVLIALVCAGCSSAPRPQLSGVTSFPERAEPDQSNASSDGLDRSKQVSPTEVLPVRDGLSSLERLPMGPGRERLIATGYFREDRSDLPEDFRNVLSMAAQIASAARTIDSVRVEGHTDEQGTMEYNMALGERRAASVARYLETLLGPRLGEPNRASRGNTIPEVAEATSEPLRAHNRRAIATLEITHGS